MAYASRRQFPVHTDRRRVAVAASPLRGLRRRAGTPPRSPGPRFCHAGRSLKFPRARNSSSFLSAHGQAGELLRGGAGVEPSEEASSTTRSGRTGSVSLPPPEVVDNLLVRRGDHDRQSKWAAAPQASANATLASRPTPTRPSTSRSKCAPRGEEDGTSRSRCRRRRRRILEHRPRRREHPAVEPGRTASRSGLGEPGDRGRRDRSTTHAPVRAPQGVEGIQPPPPGLESSAASPPPETSVTSNRPPSSNRTW